jgi:TP901 family phage tail tape measure protein
MAASAQIGALRVLLSMDAGEFSRGTRKAEKDLDDFGKSVARISERINDAAFNFNSGMQAAQRFGNVVQSIIRTTSEFGSGMSAVSTLVDTNVESMRDMTQAVLEIGRRSPVALTDLTQGLYDLRSAGTTAEDALGRLENSGKLAVAALGTTAEAVDIVTSAVNAFQLKGEEAEKLFDNIFKATAYGKMTVSQLAQGFGAVAGTVANAGVKIDEYLAAVAAMTTTGVPAAQAHTMIRAAIAGLTRESELGEKALKAFGVETFGQLVEKSGGLVNALNNVRLAFGGNDKALIKLLGSTEAHGALLSLTGAQMSTYKTALDDMRNGEEKLGEAFDKRNAGMSASMQLMQNAIQDLTIALGTALAPTIREFSEMVVGVADAFRSLSPEMQETIAKIAAIAAVLGPAAIAVTFFINAFAGLIPVIAGVGVIIAGLIAAGGPIVAFGLAASAAVTAWQIWQDDLIGIFDKVGAWLSVKLQEMMQMLRDFGAFVSGIWAKVMSGDLTGALAAMTATTTDAFAKLEMQGHGVAASYDLTSLAIQKAAANAYTYSGAIIQTTKDEDSAIRSRNSAHREGLALFNATLTPMEQLIFKQMEINGLFKQGAIDATTYGRAMAQASVFSAKNMDALASSVSGSLGDIFGQTKAVAIATALINTYQGVTKALATYPPPLAQIMAGIQLAAGMAQVANIRKQTKTGGGGGGGGGGDGGAASAVSQMPQQLMVQGINPKDMYSGDMVRDLAGKLLQYQKDGGQVVLQ